MTEIEHAVRILRGGGLVAFPTETVYGLGADATNPAAVAKIFAAKGRPATNPLIVHVADADAAFACAAKCREPELTLTDQFWPGPLTIVVRRRNSGPGGVVDAVTAGGDTVALRSPDHPVAQELLRAFGGPIAAPSANRSFHVSPTNAQHVRDDLGDRVDLILDGGPCRVGIESTVIDLSGGAPIILRAGQISREEIERALGSSVWLAEQWYLEANAPARSPGQLQVHYAPNLPAYRFERSDRDAVLAQPDPRRKLMLWGGDMPMSLARVWIMPNDPTGYAADLYRVLREMDGSGDGEIFIEMPPDEPAWLAVRDRLLRATRPARR